MGERCERGKPIPPQRGAPASGSNEGLVGGMIAGSYGDRSQTGPEVDAVAGGAGEQSAPRTIRGVGAVVSPSGGGSPMPQSGEDAVCAPDQ